MSELRQTAREAEGGVHFVHHVPTHGPEQATNTDRSLERLVYGLQRVREGLDRGGLSPDVRFGPHVPLSRNASEPGLLCVPLSYRCRSLLNVYRAHPPYIPIVIAECNP